MTLQTSLTYVRLSPAPPCGGAGLDGNWERELGRGGMDMTTREELLGEVGELAAHNEATYLG